MSKVIDKYNSRAEPEPPDQAATADSWEKGRQFEEYIVNLFHRNRFKVAEWRKAKKSDDRPFNCQYPDIEMLFFSPLNRVHKFAVECKWRKSFYEGKIRWATDEQIWNYIVFEHKWNISVYVAVGIGGSPSDPERLFVTPLRNISDSGIVFEEDLIPFNRHPKRGFFYDPRQLKLF